MNALLCEEPDWDYELEAPKTCGRPATKFYLDSKSFPHKRCERHTLLEFGCREISHKEYLVSEVMES